MVDREDDRRRREAYAAGLVPDFRIERRGDFDDASVNALHVDAFGHEPIVVAGARAVGGGWLHADFEARLRGFYFGACGFEPTDAGLIAL